MWVFKTTPVLCSSRGFAVGLLSIGFTWKPSASSNSMFPIWDFIPRGRAAVAGSGSVSCSPFLREPHDEVPVARLNAPNALKRR